MKSKDPVAYILITGHGTKIVDKKPFCEVDLWQGLYLESFVLQQQAEIEALKAENRVLRKGELWLGMVYNNRGNGIAHMYLENFMRFCETNGFTEESGYKLFKGDINDD